MKSKSRFNLVLCEIHYTPFHGKTKKSDKYIEGHFILINKFDNSNLVDTDSDSDTDLTDTNSDTNSDTDSDTDSNTDNIYTIQQLYKGIYEELYTSVPIVLHKTIRNYHNITSKPEYIKPEIGECIILPTGEYIVIIKTIWIRIIQRKWKNIVANRRKTIELRNYIPNLLNRQLTGRWDRECFNMPTLKGMLSNLLKQRI